MATSCLMSQLLSESLQGRKVLEVSFSLRRSSPPPPFRASSPAGAIVVRVSSAPPVSQARRPSPSRLSDRNLCSQVDEGAREPGPAQKGAGFGREVEVSS